MKTAKTTKDKSSLVPTKILRCERYEHGSWHLESAGDIEVVETEIHGAMGDTSNAPQSAKVF